MVTALFYMLENKVRQELCITPAGQYLGVAVDFNYNRVYYANMVIIRWSRSILKSSKKRNTFFLRIQKKKASSRVNSTIIWYFQVLYYGGKPILGANTDFLNSIWSFLYIWEKLSIKKHRVFKTKQKTLLKNRRSACCYYLPHTFSLPTWARRHPSSH